MVQSWGLILSNSNWKRNVFRPANQSTRNWPITEWIHCDEPLFNTTCQSASTSWPNLFSQLQWQTATGQSKAKYKLHHQYVECLQYRNSKSSLQKLHFFKCEYLSCYTVYELETLIIYSYSPSLHRQSFEQIKNLAKYFARNPLRL